ncbi:heterokaryon incompatibility protein-domain-containing protein [Halenospora varia]|nr:heterokaryon incompatibility protein-domain-containing protein [Halenospora varia]
MSTPSHLCSVCSAIIKQTPTHEEWQRGSDHHRTYEDFHAALDEGCFIYTVTWRHVKAQSRSTTLDDPRTFMPTKYELYFNKRIAKRRGSQYNDLISLKIEYWDTPRTGLNCNFGLIPTSDKQFRGNHVNPNISSHTSSTSTLDLAYQWFISCRGLHKQCTRLVTPTKYLPTRLIDIGTTADTHWKLHLTSDSPPTSRNYMTLSYRWSYTSCIKLLSSTYSSFLVGQPIVELPQSFQDSILVARRFGIRYLWIDCLCIQQDSATDWENESAKMKDVYANSACNIAAAASDSPYGGLFRTRDVSALQPGIIQSSSFNTDPENSGQESVETFHATDMMFWERNVTTTPLHQRGWVFQERLLAPRALHFTNDQVFWECFGGQKCEMYPLGIPLADPLRNFSLLFKDQVEPSTVTSTPSTSALTPQPNPIMSFETSQLWNDLVEAYTLCSLTMPSDKLVAISGLAHLFHEYTHDTYLAGHWRSHLLSSLYWMVYDPAPTRFRDRNGKIIYRAPTWSWASNDIRIDYRYLKTSDVYLASIIDAQVQTATDDPFGQVSSGYVILEGIEIPGRVLRRSEWVNTFLSINNDDEAVERERGTALIRLNHRNISDQQPINEAQESCKSPSSNDSEKEVKVQENIDIDIELDCLENGWREDGDGEEEGSREVFCIPLKAHEMNPADWPEVKSFGMAGLVVRAVKSNHGKERFEGEGEERKEYEEFERIGLFHCYNSEHMEHVGVLVDEVEGVVTVKEGVRRRRFRII